MKFDFIIGNPPYQDEAIGDNKTFAPPIYHKFLENAYRVGDVVEMIHPARFLFNAGNTPKQWNTEMLADPHLKVIHYEQDSSKVFSNTEIKGGIAVTLHNEKKNFGAIGTFTPYKELNSVLRKVRNAADFSSMKDIVITRTAYRLTDEMHKDYPEAINQLSNGHLYDMSTNIFERLPQVFSDSKPDDVEKYIKILGRKGNERVYKYIKMRYVVKVKNLDKYKLILPSANGNGVLGEVLSMPIIGEPLTGTTETFISIGFFDEKEEAEAALKYVKTKFSRILLGILKVTQHITPEKWLYVPMQNFTASSDIDWSKSVSEIDRQLYWKYELTEEEIAFIESHGKEME